MLTWSRKDPDETLDYGWEVPLDEGDTLAGYTATVVSGAASIASVERQEDTVVLFIAGGDAGTTCVFQIEATTAQGRTFEETFALPIVTSVVQATTARDVCDYALRKVVGVGEDAEAAELADALDLLQGLMARFSLGPVPLASSSELNLPEPFIAPLKAMLRKRVHSTYEAPLNAVDIEAASEGERYILAELVKFGGLTLSRTLTQPIGTVADLF